MEMSIINKKLQVCFIIIVGLVLLVIFVYSSHLTRTRLRLKNPEGSEHKCANQSSTAIHDNKWRIPLHKDVWIDMSRSANVSEKSSPVKTTTHVNTTYKTILIYTPYFGRKPWKHLADPSWDNRATDWKGEKYCPDFCTLTYDHKEFHKSHAVVFHGRDMPSTEKLKTLLRSKPSFQRWVFYMHENPVYTYLNLGELQGMFNWTSTYRLDSDIFEPDHYIHPLPDESRPAPARDYAKGKDRLVSWVVSNCGKYSTLRNNIVRELLNYIPIDIYGTCQKRFRQSGHTCHHDSDECLRTLARYKFNLAFENANCYHYVTEKYWKNSLINNVVPVVMDGSVLVEKLVVPRTYVNILDFPNATALAKYLKYLDRNDTAYNEYFWYKRYYKIFKPQWICRMCRKLHDKTEKPKAWSNLDTYWGKKYNCYVNDYYLKHNWLNEYPF